MFKICVIDDMKQVVDSIIQHINWSAYNMEIAGSATNGISGMELIRETKPDIVLTDIRMPLMDGLDMVVQVLEFLPQTKIIIMSGYADFEYAQRAIRLGAIDFIAKPVTPNELIRSVLKAREVLEHEREEKRILQRLQWQEKEKLPLLRQDYINLLVRYFSTAEKAQERLGMLQVPLEMKPLYVAVAEIDHYEQLSKEMPLGEVELIHFAVQNILEETLQSYTAGLVIKDYRLNQFICVMNAVEDKPIKELAEQLRSHVQLYSRYTVSIGIASDAHKLEELPLYYKKAEQALSYSFYFTENTIISYHHLVDKSAAVEPVLPAAGKLLQSILSRDLKKVQEVLQENSAGLLAQKPLPRPVAVIEAYYELAMGLFKELKSVVSENGSRTVKSTLQQMKNYKYTKYDQLYEDMVQYMKCCCQWVELEQTRDSQMMINQSVQYIKEHVHENLTIQECASLAHLSPSYYANLFKKTTGMTFRNYVTQERIELAKRLLMTDMQVQEISIRVGFEDRPYFTELFKKQTGMTPSEFKSLHARR